VFLKWLKMVLIPFLHASAGSRRQISMKNSRADAKPKAVPKSQKTNKNHLKPI
jgi:hypothetical protein